jgi:HK97 family phage prohead protease
MNSITATIKSKKDDIYSILASTKSVDRDGEVILPSAFKNLDSYLKNNPVVLGFHDYHNFPIGKAVNGKITDDALVLDIVFAQTEKGKEAKYLFDNGFMNSFSVGFIPKAWDFDAENKRVYTDVELLEVSAVPVPSNASSNIIRQAEKDGVSLKHFKSFLVDDSNPPAEADEDEDVIEIDLFENIKRMRGKYKWI